MRHDERGFTLIELVVATTVLGIIMSTISIALVLYLNATGETTDRLAESPELQIASVYLTRDAQSAEVTTSDCAPSSWSGAGFTELVSFGWRDPGDSTDIDDDNAVVVSYVVAAGANPMQKELRRYECSLLLDTPGAVIPATIATADDTQTVIALVDPSTTPSATVSASTVAVSLDVCTAKTTAAQCKNAGTSVPFDLSVSRRTA